MRNKIALFESVTQWLGCGDQRETSYEFIQRGGRDEAVPIREWMETAFQNVPCEHQYTLKQRLQSEANFMGAAFELELHELLQRQGCSFSFQPQIVGDEDFCICEKDSRYFVEATVAGYKQSSFQSNPNESNCINRLSQRLTDKLRKAQVELHLRAEGELKHTLPNSFLKEIEDTVCSLIDDPAKEIRYGFSDISHTYGEWKISGYFWPSAPGLLMPRQYGYLLGFFRSGAVDGITPTLRAIKRKRSQIARWAKNAKPNDHFLIAVNACHPELFLGDFEALTERIGLGKENDKLTRKLADMPRMSGVLLVYNAVLGAKTHAPAQLIPIKGRPIPASLSVLLNKQDWGPLLGMQFRPLDGMTELQRRLVGPHVKSEQ